MSVDGAEATEESKGTHGSHEPNEPHETKEMTETKGMKDVTDAKAEKDTQATEPAVTDVQTGAGPGTDAGTDAGTETLAAQATMPTYPVAPGVRLNVRSGPGTNYGIIRVLVEGMHVPIFCQAPGTTVTGPYGTSNIWDNIDNGQYVSDAYVYTGSDGYVASRCAV